MLEHTKHASGELRVPAPKDREQRQIRRREWLHQRKNLRMEGQMLRFKLAPSRQGGSAGPSQKATEDVSDKVRLFDYHAFHKTPILFNPATTER